ncbi:MAG: hypothetical protein RQ866_04560 [Bacteroidales bacterium]|nr:hypothetical protein [Bacteroidales bacterium]
MQKLLFVPYFMLIIHCAAAQDIAPLPDEGKHVKYFSNYFDLEFTTWGFQTMALNYSHAILNREKFFFGLSSGYGLRESFIRGPGGHMIPGFLFLCYGEDVSYFQLSMGGVYFREPSLYDQESKTQITPVLKTRYLRVNRSNRGAYLAFGLELTRFKLADGDTAENFGDNPYRISPSLSFSLGYLL